MRQQVSPEFGRGREQLLAMEAIGVEQRRHRGLHALVERLGGERRSQEKQQDELAHGAQLTGLDCGNASCRSGSALQ